MEARGYDPEAVKAWWAGDYVYSGCVGSLLANARMIISIVCSHVGGELDWTQTCRRNLRCYGPGIHSEKNM